MGWSLFSTELFIRTTDHRRFSEEKILLKDGPTLAPGWMPGAELFTIGKGHEAGVLYGTVTGNPQPRSRQK